MNKVTADQVKDTAILAGLLFLVAFLASGNRPLLWLSGLILLVALLKPVIFKPLAWVWFGFSQLLNRLMTPLVLSGVFFLVVTPIGLLRRLTGYDPMQIRPENHQRASAFSERNHKFVPQDLERPF